MADINLIMKFFLISESSHLGITKSCARLRRLCVWVLTGGSSWCSTWSSLCMMELNNWASAASHISLKRWNEHCRFLSSLNRITKYQTSGTDFIKNVQIRAAWKDTKYCDLQWVHMWKPDTSSSQKFAVGYHSYLLCW